MQPIELVEHYCMRDDLATYDPYDVWKTRPGFHAKNLFNHSRVLAYGPVILLTLYDTYINNSLRLFYRKQEYPIVRAMAALALIELYKRNPRPQYRNAIVNHLEHLKHRYCPGYSGRCWGIGFDYPVARGILYHRGTPYSTVTPYPLEAFVEYSRITGDTSYREVIASVFEFFNQDIKVMYEDEDRVATSYGPWKDRIAFNAIAYSMYSLALLLEYIPEESRAATISKIQRMYRYIVDGQGEDGSWYYAPQGRSFIDCFHSCFVLKNIVKTGRILALPAMDVVVQRGYQYIIGSFRSPDTGLFRRFTISNKPSIIEYDLYDNAEMLNLAGLLGDTEVAAAIQRAVAHHFVDGQDVYSQIDRFGLRHNRNTLRWAVMPYLYALARVAE